jgi:hypothetical protein
MIPGRALMPVGDHHGLEQPEPSKRARIFQLSANEGCTSEGMSHRINLIVADRRNGIEDFVD